MSIQCKALTIGILAACCAGSVYAQESTGLHPSLEAEFFVDLGVYFPERKLSARVNGSLAGNNETIDIDGGSQATRSENIFALEFGWRFGEKWSLRTQYFRNHPSKTVTLDEDVEWKDIVFDAGNSITLGSEFDLVRVFFGRTFETSERHDVGVGAGLHWLRIGASIKGEAIINGMPAGTLREKVSVDAPLPNIGGWYTYSISPRWAARGRVDWFAAGIDEFDGRLINGSVGINYKLFEHGGIGLSYNVFDLELDVDKSNWKGSVSTRYTGPYLSASFYW